MRHPFGHVGWIGGPLRFGHRGDSEGRAEKILKQLREQKIQAVVSTVLGEGVDIPTLSGIVLASGEKESKQQLQRIGRGLRKKKEGENVTEIFDFIDLGHPTLAKHSKERMSIYRKEGFEVQEIAASEFDL